MNGASSSIAEGLRTLLDRNQPQHVPIKEGGSCLPVCQHRQALHAEPLPRTVSDYNLPTALVKRLMFARAISLQTWPHRRLRLHWRRRLGSLLSPQLTGLCRLLSCKPTASGGWCQQTPCLPAKLQCTKPSCCSQQPLLSVAYTARPQLPCPPRAWHQLPPLDPPKPHSARLSWQSSQPQASLALVLHAQGQQLAASLQPSQGQGQAVGLAVSWQQLRHRQHPASAASGGWTMTAPALPQTKYTPAPRPGSGPCQLR